MSATLTRIEAELARAAGNGDPGALKVAWDVARATLHDRRAARPGRGRTHAAELSRVTEALICALFPPIGRHEDRLAVVAVGGYGRGELAPYSDIDLLFVLPPRTGAGCADTIRSMLGILWDLGLKVGHSTRAPDAIVAQAKADLTIRTALLDARVLCGDIALAEAALDRFRREVVTGSAGKFVAEKLIERRERHKRFGDSRYLVEPNLKEGKGGLRDLHTLFWIGKYVHRVASVDDLVGVGLLSASELKEFKRAEDFFWAVRCQLHDIAGRAEDRLTFDLQPEVARRLRYATRAGASDVERFMRHYYLHARHVGALTGVFLAELEESFGNRSWMPRITRRPKRLSGFVLRRGRIGVPRDDFFREEPTRLLELFQLADLNALEIDPAALRLATRDARLIDDRVRRDAWANALFMNVLTSPRDPETLLRQMNEAGVFGRFVPDFGRIAALTQFNMYHHYTVDEHTIRAIGILGRIESGALSSEYRSASELAHKLSSRSVLRVAVLIHDIAKGRGGDHSILGAGVAERLCPRLGLTPGETQTVAWLVRYHLVMSDTAFRRDLADPATIDAFVDTVGSPERLRMLFVLTTVDISAVGPGVWTPWKGQLLRDLYEATDARLRLGHMERGREEEVAKRQVRLAAALGWPAPAIASHTARFENAYWIAETADTLEANARLMHSVDADHAGFGARAAADTATGATQVSVYAEDRPGLFARAAGAIALSGASIVDARIHTTKDGRALDNFTVTDPLGRPFAEPRQLARLEATLARVLGGDDAMDAELAERPLARARATAFGAEAIVYFNTRASNRFTIAEVNARDRPGLVHALGGALTATGAVIRSAHIATYGERAVDVFYLTGEDGRKIEDSGRLSAIEAALKVAAGAAGEAVAA